MSDAEKRLNEANAPKRVWVTHHSIYANEPERQFLSGVSDKPWEETYAAPITEFAANTEYVTRVEADAAVALALEGALQTITAHSDTARKQLSATYDSDDALGNRVWGAIVSHLDIAHDAIRALIQSHQADALARVRQPLTFGRGEQVVTVGEAHGVPAVFIAPAKQPGTIGSDATREGNPRDTLVTGEIVLTFPTSEQAQMVADALCNDMARVRQEAHNAAREVKPLVWDARADIPGLHNADSAIGWWYNVRELHHGGFKYEGDPVFAFRAVPQWFDTLEDAKAAAQADYTARIHSALAEYEVRG